MSAISRVRPRIGLLFRRELRKNQWVKLHLTVDRVCMLHLQVNFLSEYHLQLLMESGGVPVPIPMVRSTAGCAKIVLCTLTHSSAQSVWSSTSRICTA